MDWPDTPVHLEMLAAVLGNCRLIICQAVYELNGTMTPSGCNGTTLRRVHLVRDGDLDTGPASDGDPAAILTLLDFARKARNGQPPTKKIRYCTDYLVMSLSYLDGIDQLPNALQCCKTFHFNESGLLVITPFCAVFRLSHAISNCCVP